MNPNIVTTKSVDRQYAQIGDNVNYTVVVQNTGDTDATSVNLTDLIPQGANFVGNSIYVNNVNLPGVDPALGINLGTVSIGSTVTVTMQAVVVSAPAVNPMQNSAQLDYQYNSSATTVPNIVTMSVNTNTVPTQIQSAIVNVLKSADHAFANVGDTIMYTVTIVNNGSVSANQIVFYDTIPAGTTFVPNSVHVGNTTIPGANPSPPGGLVLNYLSPGYLYDIDFKVQVASIPPTNVITNYGDAAFKYTVDPSFPNAYNGRSTSNIVTTSVSYASLNGMTMVANKQYVVCGDTIFYTLTIPNVGTTTALGVIVIDTVPNNTSFVSGSLMVNGSAVGGTPASIPVGDIAAGAISTVTYQLQVVCPV